ncbi:MAG: dihydrofolate reductase family protein [Actinomycetota bacterium]
MRRVLPEPSCDATVESAYSAVLGEPPADRPWVLLCMVSSLDGSTVVDGASGALSSPNDSAVLLGLRRLADVVLVGAGTAAGEGYGPPATPGQRIAVVTRSGHVDVDSELFRSGAGLIVTTETTETTELAAAEAAGVDIVRAGREEVDLDVALRELRRRFGATVVQAEGGPALNGALAAADLIDELDLTTSPGIVGGRGPRLTRDGADVTSAFELVQLVVDDDQFLFQRWRRRR